MGKGSGSTRSANSHNAASNRTFAANTSGSTKVSLANVSGSVKTMHEAEKVMNTYKSLYDMPEKEQKAFTDSFAQAVMNTYSKRYEHLEKEYLLKSSKAFAKGSKVDYDFATDTYNAKMKLLTEERKSVTDKYNKFIKVKK